MRRVLFLILAGAVAALAVLYGVRMLQKSPSATVSALLPRETIAFVHLPDFNRSRDQWRQSDIYQLYREPSVQEFLRKPLTKVPKKDATSQTLREIEQLDPEDAFVAVTSIDYNNPKIVGGFRFKGKAGGRGEDHRTVASEIAHAKSDGPTRAVAGWPTPDRLDHGGAIHSGDCVRW